MTLAAYEASKRLAKEGYAVITGGGHGVMEASNRGAYDVGGDSLGLNILLPNEQTLNSYTTANFQFRHFFGRKVAMTLDASAYLFFPGGFGTWDELFEVLALEQTKKIPAAPVILVGSEYWNQVDAVIKKLLLEEYQTISPEDYNLYEILDDHDEIVKRIDAYERKLNRRNK